MEHALLPHPQVPLVTRHSSLVTRYRHLLQFKQTLRGPDQNGFLLIVDIKYDLFMDGHQVFMAFMVYLQQRIT